MKISNATPIININLTYFLYYQESSKIFNSSSTNKFAKNKYKYFQSSGLVLKQK